MREKIENPVYMTFEEIQEKYIGYWVYIANANFTPDRGLIGGVPVVVADWPFKGREDGFYEEFKQPKYAPRIGKDLDYDSLPGILSIFDLEITEEKAGVKIDSNF
ncbi:MAG: hypothetical protein FWB74_06865 [Defluviitaleaceae bacterium]|nr:hypothetical protein [Defluviitaleaceae bacterium]